MFSVQKLCKHLEYIPSPQDNIFCVDIYPLNIKNISTVKPLVIGFMRTIINYIVEASIYIYIYIYILKIF